MTVLRKRPSAALVVAMIALFVALGGTAGAVVTAAVPLAKRALVADNAKKLGGQTAAQIAAQGAKAAVTLSPAGAREASTAAALVTTKSAPFSVGPQGGEQVVTATCDAGSKAVGGGFSNPTSALVISAGSFATADGTGWTEDLINLSSSTTGSGTVVAQCLK
jgi:hypothetical protein